METDRELPRRGRPAASSLAHIESVAMRLFARNGFSATTVPMIAEASGVGRATVFRYWGSKSDIVWAEFDRHIRRLAALLEAEVASEDSTMAVVRRAVVTNLGLSIEDSTVWLARFELVDESQELRAEEAEHWAEWATAIAAFVARRHGYPERGVVPQSIASAVQGAFLAVLRGQRDEQGTAAGVLLPALDRVLASVTAVLQAWLDGDPRP